MNKQNLHSLAFVLLVLTLATFGRGESDNRKNSYQDTIQTTSLSANLNPTAEPEINFSPKSLAPRPTIPAPLLQATTVYVQDVDTGLELFSTQASERWPIASITKLMTAIVALENLRHDQVIPLTQNAIDTEGSTGNFRLDEAYTLEDLVKSMLVVSSNDAAVAIADFYGHDNFVKLMKQKASALEMFQTSFFDESGLSFVNQSSVSDLSKLTVYIFRAHPEIFEITRTKTVTITERNTGAKKQLLNINAFAGRPDFFGGKTGYIDSSGGNLLSTFSYKNHRILIIVFGAEDRFKETESILTWTQRAFTF